MASPITWRNVDAPDLSGIANIMQQGNQNLDRSLTALQQLASGIRGTQIANADNVTRQNTDQLLQNIRAAQTMGQQQTLANTYTPDALRQQYGAAVDINQVQRALQEQPQQIADNAARDFKYQQEERTRADAPRLRALDQQLAQMTTSDQILQTPIPQDINDATAAKLRINEAYIQMRNREKMQLEDNLAARTTQFHNIAANAGANSPDQGAVRGNIVNAGVTLGMSPEEINNTLAATDVTYNNTVVPTDAQKNETGQLFSNYNASLEAEAAALAKMQEESKRRHPATAEYSQLQEADKNITQGDALKLLPGWDNNHGSWWDSETAATGEELRTEYVLPNLARFEKEIGRSVPGWMVAKAAKMTGEANSFSFQPETNSEAFDANLRKVYEQYQQEQDEITKEQNLVAIRSTLLNEAKQRHAVGQQQSKLLLEQLNRAKSQNNAAQQADIEGKLKALYQGFRQPYQWKPAANK